MKIRLLTLLLIVPILYGCNKFDDSNLWNSINSLNNRVERLEIICDKMNTNISSLQSIVQALQTNDAVKSVTILPDGEGYTINFVSGKTINIYNGRNGANGSDGKDGKDGRDGKNGVTPVISVKKDIDGIYYWTVDGEWLIVDGNKVKAVGADGLDGRDGVDGENGSDGTDGMTPKFKIENGYWYVSYDNEQSWKQLGKATGDNGLNGSSGESFFKGVSMENGYVCFVLNDAEAAVIKLPFVSDTELSMSVEPGALKSRISAGQERTLLRLKISGNVNDADIKYIRYYMTNLEYLDLSETQLVSIPAYAFEGMTRIKEVTLPKSCNSIGDNAFANCRILCSVSAPGATIPASAISSCENLERLECANIEGRIENLNLELILMGDNSGKVKLPFAYNESQTVMKIKKLVFGSTTTEITNHIGSNDKNMIDVTEIYFDPQSKIPVIADGVFTKSGSLRKITFPVSLTSLGQYAFEGCPNLSDIFFPEGCMLKELRYNTEVKEKSIFTGANITSVTFPKNIQTIAGNVFYGTSLDTITILDNGSYLQLTHGTYSSYYNTYNQWTYYEIGVFENLKNLKTIICHRTIPPVCTQYAFNGLNEQFFYSCTLFVPKSAIDNYKSDAYWGKFKNILPIVEQKV